MFGDVKGFSGCGGLYVDLAWGIALTAAVSASGYGFGKWLGL